MSENFVPAAINLYRVRQATDGTRELFLSIQAQKDQYQGIWIVSPDGKVLSGRQDYVDFKNGSRELLETIDQALEAFGPVEPRRTQPVQTISAALPYRGKGVRPDGSVDLALYVRQVLGGGRETIPTGVPSGRAWVWDGQYRTDGPPVIDTVSLAPTDWAAFTPQKIEPGARWSVPEKVARAFTRLLSASSDQSGMPLPRDASVAEIECVVESVSGGQVQIRLSGRWEMIHAIERDKSRLTFGAATGRGKAVYDMASGSLQSFLLVLDGTIRFGRADAAPNRTGAVAEWESH